MKKNISLISFILVALLALTACSFGNQFADPVVESTTGTVTPAAPATEEQKEPIVVEYESCLLSFKGEDYEVMVGKTLQVEGGELYCIDANTGGIRGNTMEVYDPPADSIDNGEDKSKAESAADASSNCRDNTWWEHAQADTSDVASLISLLDRDFKLDEGGQWSEPGYSIDAGSIFWTDLFGNVENLPSGVSKVRTQGGWGVYFTSVSYTIPADSGGGRFMRLCSTPTVSETTADANGMCLTATDAASLTTVDSYNEFFESEGWVYGHAVDRGAKAEAGGLFLGTFPSSSPKGATNVGDGMVWHLTADVTAPEGGRWMALCQE